VRPGIALIWAGFYDLVVSLCPVRIIPVAVHPFEQAQVADLLITNDN
jgi:hypothetical protein